MTQIHATMWAMYGAHAALGNWVAALVASVVYLSLLLLILRKDKSRFGHEQNPSRQQGAGL